MDWWIEVIKGRIMVLESEVYYLLIVFFAITLLINCSVLIWCFTRTQNKAIMWFAAQVVFLILSFCFFYECIINPPDPTFAMYSEEQSLTLAYAGVSWILSVLAELVGICKMTKKHTINIKK